MIILHDFNKEALSYDDISILPNHSDIEHRSEIDVSVGKYKTPIINSPMYHTSNPEMIDYMLSEGNLTTIHRYFDSPEEQLKEAKEGGGDKWKEIFFSVGKDRKWIDALYAEGVKNFLVDMANGHSDVCINTVKYIAENCFDVEIMAGSVATGEGAKLLYLAGANYIRVGIASGSICSTELNTGVGLPMVTSILDVAEVLKYTNAKIIADGGIRTGGDMLKAIACGADFVMCGKLLAATLRSRGPFYSTLFSEKGEISSNGDSKIRYVEYGGMASTEVRKKASTQKINKSVEGVHGRLLVTGDTKDVVDGILLNIRSGMSYCGARNFKKFKEDVRLFRISGASRLEKMTHLEA